jgi:HD-like signal output (HDOD) protein
MDIDSLFADLHTLPSIPKVVQDLIQQFDNPSSDLESVAKNIERDPVISAKVLRLANSARFRGARESSSIEDAAMRLGFNTLRTLVLASGVTVAFKSAANFDLKEFWADSFRVASVSRLLAKQAGLDVNTAFSCGMMHNIGELLIQTGAPDLASKMNMHAHRDAAGRAADETLQFGFGYPEVGAELTRRWSLPKVIQHAIAFQVRPSQCPPEDAGYARTLAQACQICDAMTRGGLTPEARLGFDGPLFEGMDLDKLFTDLPSVLEADRAFVELLG